MICLAVTYVLKPGTEDDAVGRLRILTEATRKEPGCRFYQAHRSTTDPRKFFLYETRPPSNSTGRRPTSPST